ncbi:hypothetical protein [uncultured Gammaproteobacteria bacterium]|nr:hypothetical protein [uncultured Gammaproteobacteria bacterium]CAC9963084.1 hypothetical protein [uncultured Gammaproteobacteria bacterium]
MGERSKNSGELGESYVANFLALIGWDASQSNETINCIEPGKHRAKNSTCDRTTHGIDKLYTYESPMDSNTLIHSVISVKHTINEYPSSPNTKFKEHFTDLAHAIECFKESELIIKNREAHNVDNEEIVGILFWLSGGGNNSSLISKLKNPTLEESLLYERIHILDDDRIEFITKSINLIKKKFDTYQHSFYYIDTPNNLTDNEKQYNGKSLPIEMLSSNIQVFKLVKRKEIILAIVLKDKFHADDLKRILGLAHRISNNLTSNVQIFFPLFEHEKQENINSVNRIKNQFKERDFISATHIFGYDIGFKDTDKSIDMSLITPSEDIKDEEIDNGKILPYGEQLRSLLDTSLITESELKNVLQEKGIYVCNSKKEHTIPILASFLLSPKEFNTLKEHQKTKEDKEKRYESRFKTKVKPTTEKLKQSLRSINLNDLDKNKFKNYKYKNSNVTFEVDKSKNQLIVNYEIERYQRNKSWNKQTDYFKGAVILDCNNNSEIIAKNISTSKETLEINKNIVNHIHHELIENNIISQTTKEEKILMDDMNNKEILQFLLAFHDNKILANVEFINIISIDIEIDETITLPDLSQIKWMEKKIKKLKLDGKKIEDIEIITNTENHEYLKCWGLTAEYKYNNPRISGEGVVIIDFKFNTTNKNEFFIQIGKCIFNKKEYKQTEINEMILSDIDNIKHKKHKEIMGKKI